MRDKVLAFLRRVPGARKREIAHAIGCWQCDADFLHLINILEEEGFIYSIPHNDPTQMEFYDKWYIKI